MNIKRIFTFLAGALIAAGVVSAQSYFDDDIYFDPAKASKPAKKASPTKNNRTAVVVYDYPSADNYTVNGTRSISVDDYNRRGIFATDSLTADTTATDFAYTRRIEQFYNPQIVSGSGDEELANIYYMEPDQVNIYVNTPSAYWGYDYFYPYNAWTSPYWYNNYWRWNSAWYWGTWYDPYWAWNWGPGWGYPGWGFGWNYPGWGYPGWGPGWGWGGPVYTGPRRAPNLLAGRHPGVSNTGRPSNARPNGGYVNSRPNVSTNRYPAVTNRRPNVTTNRRPNTNTTTNRPTTNQRPNNNYNNNNYNNYNPNSIGGRYGTGSYGTGSFGGSRGSGMSTGGGSRGGRGRH